MAAAGTPNLVLDRLAEPYIWVLGRLNFSICTRAVASALEEIARWSIEYCGDVEMIDRATVVNEVREINMATGSCDRIISELEQASFQCSWVLQTFDAQIAGFRLEVLPNAG